jgi:hypothetical protein
LSWNSLCSLLDLHFGFLEPPDVGWGHSRPNQPALPTG